MKINGYFIKALSLCAVFILLLSPSCAYAQSTDPLAPFEKQLFARNYSQEPLATRLSRLETVVFGKPQSGDVQDREAKLEAVLSQNMSTTPSNPTTTSSQNNEDGNSSNTMTNSAPVEHDATDYPTVTQMEQKVFHQGFTGQDISQRLTRLEQRVFNRTYDQLSLEDRVDQLKEKILSSDAMNNSSRESSDILPDSSDQLSSGNLAIYSQVSTLEQQLLGHTYGGEMLSTRLSRLERHVFGAPQPGSIDDRMDNLMSHYRQTMSPQQEGGQPYVGHPQAYTPYHSGSSEGTYSQPQQMMIGGGMSGSSTQFSQEFLDMMPPNIRQLYESQRMQNYGASPQYNSTQPPQVYTGPQTWTHQSEAFVPYNNPPSMYSNPGIFSQSIPYNQQQTYTPPNPMNYPGGALGNIMPFATQTYGNMMPNYPMSGVNVMQSLTLLEDRTFGHSYDGESMFTRLNNLEQQVLGATYPQYSIQQRITQLMQHEGYQQSAIPMTTPTTGKQSLLKSALGQILNNMMMNQTSGYNSSSYGSPFYQQQTTFQQGW